MGSATVEVGAAAPDFSLPDQHGGTVTLSALRGKVALVVFYPFSFTGICTNELCQIRDALPELQNDQVQVLAISCDAMSTQRVFAEAEGLEFPVLSDFWPHGAAARAYGVFDDQRGAALRGSFAVDPSGTVRWTVVHQMGEPRTLGDYLNVVRHLLG